MEQPQDSAAEKARRRAEIKKWKAIVAEHQKPHLGRALWQVVNTFGSYIAVWVLIWFLQGTWWATLPLAMLAGALTVRMFIIFHDCGHGSFFKSRTANTVVGWFCGLFTWTPYGYWSSEHAQHHAASGDLDRRGVGDIWTLTVQEYIESSRWKRFAYRLARNPVILFVVAPIFLFTIWYRFPAVGSKPKEKRSVWLMNVALVFFVLVMGWIFGFGQYLILQLVAMAAAGSSGVWLFYVQHQFEDVYWERGDNWDFTAAALQGSSFYKLPKVLQWFSGNIGYHHIHHLCPSIPNYNLERCHHSDPLFHEVPAITLFTSFKSFTYRLWDESSRKLVGYRRMNEIRREKRERETAAGNANKGDMGA